MIKKTSGILNAFGVGGPFFSIFCPVVCLISGLAGLGVGIGTARRFKEYSIESSKLLKENNNKFQDVLEAIDDQNDLIGSQSNVVDTIATNQGLISNTLTSLKESLTKLTVLVHEEALRNTHSFAGIYDDLANIKDTNEYILDSLEVDFNELNGTVDALKGDLIEMNGSLKSMGSALYKSINDLSDYVVYSDELLSKGLAEVHETQNRKFKNLSKEVKKLGNNMSELGNNLNVNVSNTYNGILQISRTLTTNFSEIDNKFDDQTKSLKTYLNTANLNNDLLAKLKDSIDNGVAEMQSINDLVYDIGEVMVGCEN